MVLLLGALRGQLDVFKGFDGFRGTEKFGGVFVNHALVRWIIEILKRAV
jgi:hypothetical protein